VGQRREPRVRVARRRLRLRPQHVHQFAAAQAGHRGDHHRGRRARPRPRRRPLHDLPDHPRSGRLLVPTPRAGRGNEAGGRGNIPGNGRLSGGRPDSSPGKSLS
jgi:hypothetical protein